ncbi:MAG: sulfotransferase family protein [Egibacteraceae bacterium]
MSLGHRANAGVVFIGSAAHSGATLLGVMLGAHPSILYAGEAGKSLLLGNPSWPLKMRVCRLCGPDCVVWGNLRVTGGEDLYETLSRRTNRPIVVDSSSSVDWIAQQATALGVVVPLRLIVLARDGRAVVNSRLRKYPETSARDQAAAWVAHMRATEALASRWPGPVHRVRYEELATRPEPTMRALADFLGVAFGPGMLDPWDSDPHPLGSNDGPLLLLLRERAKRASGHGTGVVEPDDKTRDWYAAHPRGIVLDLRWKHELSADALATFEQVAGETNRAYA